MDNKDMENEKIEEVRPIPERHDGEREHLDELARRRAAEGHNQIEQDSAETAQSRQDVLVRKLEQIPEADKKDYIKEQLRQTRLRADERAHIRSGGDAASEIPQQPEMETRLQLEKEQLAAQEKFGELKKLSAQNKIVFSESEPTSMDSSSLVLDKSGDSQGWDSSHPEFWNHHGNTHESYQKLAESYPRLQEKMAEGYSIEELKNDPELKDAAQFWYSETDIVTVTQYDGHRYVSNGIHRVELAKEYNLGNIPVDVKKAEHRP